eukprot:m.135555 g.135555  ORF g.135555 m.135555 type:complete len:454 (+) comp29802_c0_seq1:168-1529(+)
MTSMWKTSLASGCFPGNIIAKSGNAEDGSASATRSVSSPKRIKERRRADSESTTNGLHLYHPLQRFTPHRVNSTPATSPLPFGTPPPDPTTDVVDDLEKTAIPDGVQRHISMSELSLKSLNSLNATNNASVDGRLSKFLSILNAPSLDLVELRLLSWSGVPSDVRPTVWRLLNGYLPVNMDRRSSILQRRRLEYRNSVDQHYPLRKEKANARMLHQIQSDIVRSSPTSLFDQELTKQMFERILFLYHLRHPATGYVQGMNDLVLPFFVVFLTPYCGENIDGMILANISPEILWQIEADSYWCVTLLIDKIQDYFIQDRDGLQRQLGILQDLIERIDKPLHLHLREHNVPEWQFAFRWMNCLLMRELPLLPIIRLWDAYLAENDGFTTLHLYTCAALITTFSERIRALGDMSEILPFILNLPTEDWTPKDVALLLAEAYKLKFTFENAPNHLSR